jgi:hypothetical protein
LHRTKTVRLPFPRCPPAHATQTTIQIMWIKEMAATIDPNSGQEHRSPHRHRRTGYRSAPIPIGRAPADT